LDRRWIDAMAKALIAASVVSALIVVFSGGGLAYVLSTAGGVLLCALILSMQTGDWGSAYAPFQLVTEEGERYQRALRRTQLSMAALGVLWVLFVVWVVGGSEWLTLVLAALGVLVVTIAGSVILKLLLHLDGRP
jgi:hypothetical protein